MDWNGWWAVFAVCLIFYFQIGIDGSFFRQRLYHIAGMTHFPFALCLERQASHRRRAPITTAFTHDWSNGSIPVPVSCSAFPRRQSISRHSTVDQPLSFTYPESRAYHPTWCKRGVCMCWKGVGFVEADDQYMVIAHNIQFFHNNHRGRIGEINAGPTGRLHTR